MRRAALAATTIALLFGCAASANAAGSGELSALEAQGPDFFDSSAPRFPGTRPPEAGSEELRVIRRTAEAGNRGAFDAGWVTRELSGPFKGEPGSEDW